MFLAALFTVVMTLATTPYTLCHTNFKVPNFGAEMDLGDAHTKNYLLAKWWPATRERQWYFATKNNDGWINCWRCEVGGYWVERLKQLPMRGKDSIDLFTVWPRSKWIRMRLRAAASSDFHRKACRDGDHSSMCAQATRNSRCSRSLTSSSLC